MAANQPTKQPPPHAQLVQMATAYWASQILYAAAKLNLADHLQRRQSETEITRILR